MNSKLRWDTIPKKAVSTYQTKFYLEILKKIFFFVRKLIYLPYFEIVFSHQTIMIKYYGPTTRDFKKCTMLRP
jgi:hypothetical protein